MMKVQKLFKAKNREEWRAWLENHFEDAADIWLVFPLKAANEPSVSYNDAVEEALCFGWIDSTQKRIDDTHRAQRFCPRRKGSPYSQPNIERLKWLDEQNMIHPKIRPLVEKEIASVFEYPQDILDAVHADNQTWGNFCSFSEPYKRIRVAYIDAARNRPEEFQKRLDNFLNKTHDGKLIVGYGGIDKYYC